MYTLYRVKARTPVIMEDPSPGRKSRILFVEDKRKKDTYNSIATRHGIEPGKYCVVITLKDGKTRVIRPEA